VQSLDIARRARRSSRSSAGVIRERKVDLANRPPVIKIEDDSIKFKRSVRYIVVWLDQRMGVKSHCEKLGDRIDKLFANLS